MRFKIISIFSKTIQAKIVQYTFMIIMGDLFVLPIHVMANLLFEIKCFLNNLLWPRLGLMIMRIYSLTTSDMSQFLIIFYINIIKIWVGQPCDLCSQLAKEWTRNVCTLIMLCLHLISCFYVKHPTYALCDCALKFKILGYHPEWNRYTCQYTPFS